MNRNQQKGDISMNSVLATESSLFTQRSEKANLFLQVPKKIVRLSEINSKPVLLDFNGGAVSSDAGVLLLREVEQQLGIIAKLAATINDQRDARYVKHSVIDLMMQRVAQIACGYEDADDCDTLRTDPIFKLFAGRDPESGPNLGSQPTMSRFENSISRTYLYRLAQAFVDVFIDSYRDEPNVIVLDFDDTESEVNGGQQLSLFNGYFNEYCYMPLHVYEGLSGKLITTILKPGKRATGKQMLAIVKRLVKYLRHHWPNTLIIYRGDSHFAYPEVMEWIDQQDNVMYVTGLTANKILQEMAATLLERAVRLYEKTQRKVRLFHSVHYKAETWNKYRRVIIKAEVSTEGTNLRFIVTDMEHAKATVLYQQIYCARGTAELYIKDHKVYLKSNRTSCHRFAANQFRLFLHSAAYVLIHALKTNILRHTQWGNATIATIRLRLFKIGACVRELKTRIKVELPSSCPVQATLQRAFQIFAQLAPT